MFCLRTCSDLKLADWREGSMCVTAAKISSLQCVCVNNFWINDNMQKAWSVSENFTGYSANKDVLYCNVSDGCCLRPKTLMFTFLWHFSFWVQPPKGRLIRKLKSSFHLLFKKTFAKNSQNFVFGFILEDYICICSKQLVHATKRQPSLKLLNRLYRWHVQELSQSCHVLFSYDDYINNTLCTVEERLFNSLVVFLNVLVWRAWSCMASAVMSHAPSA